VDNGQQRHFAKMAVQHALSEMGDSVGRSQRDLWQAGAQQTV
jgi:hypothetical protein